MPLFGRHHYDGLVTGTLDSHRSAAGLYLFRGRSQPVGVTTLFGVVLVLPLIVQSLPTSWQNNISKFRPLNIADHMMSTRADPFSHALSNGWGAIMLVIYAVAALAIGLAVLKRRDV